MKVKIVDTLSYRTFHEVFNGAVVYMCLHIFDKVHFYASSTTYATIRKLIDRYDQFWPSSSLVYKKVFVLPKEKTFGGLVKYLLSAWLNIWHLWTAPANTQIIYTNNNPLSLWGIVLCNYLLKKKVVIFCHGELELLLRSPRIYKPSFLYKYIFVILFRYGYLGPYVKLCVLGNSILQNLRPYLNKRNQSNVFSIEHPYFFSHEQSPFNMPHFPLKLGTVGTMTKAKGLQSLIDLASSVGRDVHLSVVGRLMDTVSDKEGYIHFMAGKDENIPRDQYEKAIQELDFILFLYPTDTYKLIASGAIFDAIDLGKPVIAFSNAYFDHVFSISIGYVCKDLSQMINKIQELIQHPEQVDHDYPIFLQNIEELRKRFDVKTVTSQFKQQLSCIYM